MLCRRGTCYRPADVSPVHRPPQGGEEPGAGQGTDPDPALAAVDRIFRTLSDQGFAYLPHPSTGEVVTFRRIQGP